MSLWRVDTDEGENLSQLVLHTYMYIYFHLLLFLFLSFFAQETHYKINKNERQNE